MTLAQLHHDTCTWSGWLFDPKTGPKRGCSFGTPGIHEIDRGRCAQCTDYKNKFAKPQEVQEI